MPTSGAIAVWAWFLSVSATTVLVESDRLPLTTISSSPHLIARGRVWRLVTSGFVVQRPLVASFVALAVLLALAMATCGLRLVVFSAIAGHIGSTLLAYSMLAVWRLTQPHAFASVLTQPDYGVSAISAAWLGAIAATSWKRREQTRQGRTAIAFACVAVALFAWMLRRTLTIIDSDHVFAFAIGVALAVRLHAATSPSSRAAWLSLTGHGHSAAHDGATTILPRLERDPQARELGEARRPR